MKPTGRGRGVSRGRGRGRAVPFAHHYEAQGLLKRGGAVSGGTLEPRLPRRAAVETGGGLDFAAVVGGATVGAHIDAFEEYNRVLRSSAAEQGAILIECEEAVPADGEHFNDSIHFLDPGCRLFAERVAAGIEAAPAFRALLASRD